MATGLGRGWRVRSALLGPAHQRSAGENRSQLAIIVVWHWSIPLGVLMLRFAL